MRLRHRCFVAYDDTHTINVHVTQPNASPDQIANAVHQKIQGEKSKELTRLFPQVQGTY
jgi:hypothetical protein